MRWKQTQFRDHDTRVRSGFLFFPRCCGGERRWWEWATWEEQFHICYGDTWWENVRWLDQTAVKN